MLRLPKPRPFAKYEPARPKLANVLMLLIFSPYAVFLSAVVVAAGYAIYWLATRAFGGT